MKSKEGHKPQQFSFCQSRRCSLAPRRGYAIVAQGKVAAPGALGDGTTHIDFPFPVLHRPWVGAKQEKGKVHFNVPYPGRRFALPWATIALSFQDAIFGLVRRRPCRARGFYQNSTK